MTGLSPSGGPIGGGTVVTVTGSGFAPGTTGTKFTFGSTKGTLVSCSSSTECSVRAPAHEAGTVDVVATVNKVLSPKEPLGDAFTYS